MNVPRLSAWLCGIVLLTTGATLLCAQPPQPARERGVLLNRAKLRAELVTLQTEVEMLRFDYDVARDAVLEELKMARGLKMAGEAIASVSTVQAAIIDPTAKPPGEASRQQSDQDKKKAATEAKIAAEQEKAMAAEEAAFIAERKQELSRRFALFAEKRLDLEDAERNYRASSP